MSTINVMGVYIACSVSNGVLERAFICLVCLCECMFIYKFILHLYKCIAIEKVRVLMYCRDKC